MPASVSARQWLSNVLEDSYRGRVVSAPTQSLSPPLFAAPPTLPPAGPYSAGFQSRHHLDSQGVRTWETLFETHELLLPVASADSHTSLHTLGEGAMLNFLVLAKSLAEPHLFKSIFGNTEVCLV